VWKIKPLLTASSRALTAAAASVAVVRTRRRRSVCDGLEIIRRRRRSNQLGHNPHCHNSVGHRVFLLKTDTNPYSWPYPTHEAGSWPQPTHERQKTRGLWPRGVCPKSFGRTPPETIGDSRTEFNRILCTIKSEAAVTTLCSKKTCDHIFWW